MSGFPSASSQDGNPWDGLRTGLLPGHPALLWIALLSLVSPMIGLARSVDAPAQEFRSRSPIARPALTDTACGWRDLEVLYRGSPAPGYDESSCEDRPPVEEWIWRLGDPLWLVPGNDRLTEHLARRVRDRMQTGGAASPFGEPWGPDLRERLRSGWPGGI